MNSKYTTLEQNLITNIDSAFKIIDPSEEDLMALIRDIALLGISQRALALDYLMKAKALTVKKLEEAKSGKPKAKPPGPTWN